MPPTPPRPKGGPNWFEKLPPAGKAGVVLGAVVVGYLGYKRYAAAKAAASGTGTTGTAATASSGCPAGYMDDGTGTGNCVPIPAMQAGSGGGYGGGGSGGGGSGLGQEILSALNGLSNANSNNETLSGGPTPGKTNNPFAVMNRRFETNNPTTPGNGTGGGATTSAATGTAPVNAAAATSSSTGAPQVPFSYVRIYTAPNGQQYYALGNTGQVAAAKAAGYSVVGGKTISGANPSANYVAVKK